MRLHPTLLFLFFTVLSTCVRAQVRQGEVYVDADTRLGYEAMRFFLDDPGPGDEEFEDQFGVYLFNQRLGYALADRLLVGIRSTYERGFDDRLDQLELMPFVRYYFLEFGQQRPLQLFGELAYGPFSFQRSNSFRRVDLAVGLEVNLVPGLVATVSGTYERFTRSPDFYDAPNIFGLTTAANLVFGQLAPLGQAPARFPARGTFQVGANLLDIYYYQFREGDNSLSLRLSPEVGYFVADGLLVGLALNGTFQLGIDQPGEVDPELDYFQSRNSDAELRLRYYPLTGRRLSPFAEASGGYRYYRYLFQGKEPFREVDTELKTVQYGLSVGASYFVSPQVSVDVLVDYQRASKQSDRSELLTGRDRTLRLEAGFSMYILRGAE